MLCIPNRIVRSDHASTTSHIESESWIGARSLQAKRIQIGDLGQLSQVVRVARVDLSPVWKIVLFRLLAITAFKAHSTAYTEVVRATRQIQSEKLLRFLNANQRQLLLWQILRVAFALLLVTKGEHGVETRRAPRGQPR